MEHWLKITFETFTNNPAELGLYLYHHLKKNKNVRPTLVLSEIHLFSV